MKIFFNLLSGILLTINALPIQFDTSSQSKIVIDSDFTFEEVFHGKTIPEKVLKHLELVSVEYYSFDDILHRGQIVIHKDLADEILDIFELIKAKRFPIAKVIPINKYFWSDDSSMAANNTSAFNYRYVKGTKKLSAHSLGRAIDINPLLNPQIKNGKTYPAGSTYDPKEKGTITHDSFIVREFTKRGWKWGGYWKRNKDYQHFEKLN